MRHEITGAIFDMDGTLIDSLGLWGVLWPRLGEVYLGSDDFYPSAEDDKTIRTSTLAQAMELIHTKYHFGKNMQELFDLASSIFADYYYNTVVTKPGVMEFLEHLESLGVKMCIATATNPELLKIALEKCDLKKHFPIILSCADIGKGKDEPDIFYAALDSLGTDKETTWVFEDSAVAVATAAKAGFKTVGIYDKFNYGHDDMKKAATEYIADGETLLKLI